MYTFLKSKLFLDLNKKLLFRLSQVLMHFKIEAT